MLRHSSTVSELNTGLTRSFMSERISSNGTGASVVTKTSIVARFGAIIPIPFAHPPTRNGPAPAVAVLIFVSVVQMASANAIPPSSDSGAATVRRAGEAVAAGTAGSKGSA